MMNEKETQYVQSLEEENAKLRQENQTLKQLLSNKQTQNHMFWVGIQTGYPFPDHDYN